jgi:DNA-binding IclR family transcriptional regulator
VQLGMSVADRIDLRSAAHGELERLVARTHETAFLAVPHQGTLINVDMAVSDAREFRTEPRLGARRPLHCSSLGKALLAALDDDLVEQIVDRAGMEPVTRFSITDKGTLLEDIARTRERGYAVDEHEAVLGICCVGAPVRDHLGRPVGSISIATIADLFQPEVQGAAVLESAVIISSLLGWLGDAKTLYQPVPGSLELLLGPGVGKER